MDLCMNEKNIPKKDNMLICSKIKEQIFMFMKAEKQCKFKQFWIKNV